MKAFNVIKAAGGQSQTAIFEYIDSSITDGVVAGMNKLDLAGSKLAVQRVPLSSAAMLLKPSASPNTNILPTSPTSASAPASCLTNGPQPQLSDVLDDFPASCVIRLSNMTTPEDLRDNDAYEELLEDVADECNTHGTVKSIVIPRGTGGAEDAQDASIGRIFVSFVDLEGAKKARAAVAGRRFNGNVVRAHFFPEQLFAKKVGIQEWKVIIALP